MVPETKGASCSLVSLSNRTPYVHVLLATAISLVHLDYWQPEVCESGGQSRRLLPSLDGV
jgi:hypothetical protein